MDEIERIMLDRIVKKLAWMEKERQSDWKWKKIESNLKLVGARSRRPL